jgi:WD40 repeat protein
MEPGHRRAAPLGAGPERQRGHGGGWRGWPCARYAGTGNAIYLWDATTGASLGTISDPGGSGVDSLAFNMTGTQLAVADKNGTTYVWSLAG